MLIGLSEVAGHYRGLKDGFQQLGLECTFVNLSEHPFGFDADDNIWPVGWVQKIDTQRRKATSLPMRLLYVLLQGLLQAVLFFRLLPNHDIFIYCANRNFIAFLDLPILKLCGKKIIYQMHGCDSRAPYFDGAYNHGDLLPDQKLYRLTTIKKIILAITERYADVIVNIPPQAHLCRKKYINWLYVGLCCSPPGESFSTGSLVQSDSSIVKILHSPSRPGAKGTERIRASIERLKARGVNVAYTELIGVDNSRVIEELNKADLVIDQIFADYAMPGFATEAAWQGKPVLISGYAVSYWPRWMEKADLPPTYYCHPDEFDDALYRLATDSGLRLSVGKKMHDFVRQNWSPKQIATNYLRALDTPPEKWWIYPQFNDYLLGCSISEQQLKKRLRTYLNKYGASGLRLGCNIFLVEKIYRFAELSHLDGGNNS